jgi:uncharacterized protein (TIGR02996 family)
MSDEAAFLQAILADPEDDAPRLVYADWLDDTADPAAAIKANYLRDSAALLSADGEESKRIELRLYESARSLDRDWLATVSKLALEECWLKFEFECPMRWEKLTATNDVAVRHCDQCQQSVYYCKTLTEARAHANRGECVAVDLGIRRNPNDLHPPRTRTLGRIRRPYRPAID